VCSSDLPTPARRASTSIYNKIRTTVRLTDKCRCEQGNVAGDHGIVRNTTKKTYFITVDTASTLSVG